MQDEDDPSSSSAFVALRSGSGRVAGPYQVPSAQEVLALGWGGRSLYAVTGDSPPANPCCSQVSVARMGSGGRFGRGSTLLGGLAGATSAALVPVRHHLLAAVATERGVWAAQSGGSGRWGRARRLGRGASELQATAQGGGSGVIAWSGARTISIAAGGPGGPPRRSHVAITAPRGHTIEELALAPAGHGSTAAWVESWFDRRGNYHSEVVAADFARRIRRTTFAVRGTIASGITLAGDGRGGQLLVWEACTWSASCSIQAATRSAGRAFGRSSRLGSSDAGEAPAAARSTGAGVVGWISGGHVMARTMRPGSSRFSAAQTVSSTTFAANLALAFGSTRQALLAWSQGTFAPDLVGAVYRR